MRVWHKQATTPLAACQQGDGDWAGSWAWVPTRPSSPWQGSPSASLADPSTISACPGPTGGTAWWKWRPVASTPSPRREKNSTMDVFCFSRLVTGWMLTEKRPASLQVCAVESAPAGERGFHLPHTAGFRVRSSVNPPRPEYKTHMIDHCTVCCSWECSPCFH